MPNNAPEYTIKQVGKIFELRHKGKLISKHKSGPSARAARSRASGERQRAMKKRGK